uniref:Putative rna-directed dna polymerase from transposon bs n=1 Tax=Panstrongylus lignarius TaxID=156445 RepID=A0A224Y1F2_9HEMI
MINCWTKITQVGLPQGSILSCLLYAVYASDLANICHSEIKLIQYADDICLYSTIQNVSSCVVNLDPAMKKFFDWSRNNGFNLTVNKCVVCPFSRKRSLPLGNEVRLGGTLFPCKTKVRFLGRAVPR